MYGQNCKHALWLLISALKTHVSQVIAWGSEMEQAYVDGVTDIADMQPKVSVLKDGKIVYQPQSLKDYTAHYPYGDYKYLIQTKGFAYNKFYDDHVLDGHHAKYAALDVIALQDTIDGVYSHLHTL